MKAFPFLRARAQEPYRRVPNLNLVPKEFRPGRLTLPMMAALLVVVVALALAFTSYQDMSEKNRLSSDIQAQLTRGEASLKEAQAKLAEATRLRKETADLKAQASTLQEDLKALASQKVAWSRLLEHIQASKPENVAITALTLEGNKAAIQGQAPGVIPLLLYRDSLGRSPLVSNVSDLKTSPVPGDPTKITFEMSLQVAPGGP